MCAEVVLFKSVCCTRRGSDVRILIDLQVWEGQGVIKYGRKLIGATNPQASEPGTIRGDLCVQVSRNIIHGSDGPETAVNEIGLWFKPEELVSYTKNDEKWLYE